MTSERSMAEQAGILASARACLSQKVPLWQLSTTVERLGDPEVLAEGSWEAQTRWEAEVRSAVRTARPDIGGATQELEEWTDEGLHLTTVLDDHYPLNLRFIWDRPPFLLYRGELRRDDAFSLAVVGTRKPSAEGRARARKMARLLAGADVTVLSGLALGIDTAAHTATLESGGRTIAVLGSGHHNIYPKANAALAHAIAERGALVSQFFPATPPTRGTFPIRNAVTSGISQGTIVIEASITSGARMQARLAIEHGKRAFLLRSLLEQHEWARDFASRQGVVVISDVAEAIDHLVRPDELVKTLRSDGERIRASIAEPPNYVQRRMPNLPRRGEEQLALGDT